MGTEDDKKLAEEARHYVRAHKKTIIEKFASLASAPSTEKPFTLFMAGSPGAGKTEFSKSYINELMQKNSSIKVVRIDADEIRNELPQYTGGNAAIVQGACAIAVEKLFDAVQERKQNAIVDGTFSDYAVSYKDVTRALGRGRKVDIYYLYQDPLVAWDFTQKREAIEHRHVSKKMFIDSFFAAKDNVNKVKEELGKAIELSLIIKNYDNSSFKSYFNIEKVDNYLDLGYTKEELEAKL